MARASHPAKKFPTMDTRITTKNARLTSRSRSGRVHDESSGRFRRCWGCQNMNAHQAVRESAHTRIVFKVIARMGPRKSSPIGAARGAFSRADVHSSGSGTLRRIQNTRKAGRIPTRKTLRGGKSAIK
jgi:hypothetical protein